MKQFALIAILMMFLLVLLIVVTKKEKPFKQVELSYYNQVTTLQVPKFYDTIARVALDELNLKGQSLLIEPLAPSVANQFDINAHVREHNNTYYVFINPNLKRDEAIDVICHEMIHIDQYNSKRLIYKGGNVIVWEGKDYDATQIEYPYRDWEREATMEGTKLSRVVSSTLY